MTQIIADRFMARGGEWLDLATGARIRMHIAPAGPVARQLLWSARCAAQANLRHPLLNALVDFGAAGSGRTFEAYEPRGPVHAEGLPAQALLTHAVRFLEAHGIELTRPLADLALRPILAGPREARESRPVGVVLQRRNALDAINDALAAAAPAGACAVTIAGPPHSGLRTLRLMAARAARLQGYTPVTSALIQRGIARALTLDDRHVCVLTDAESTAAPAWLARLGAEGGRRHVVLVFRREAPRQAPAVRLDSLGMTAMTAMVFAERDYGPTPDQIFEAARRAEGLPGRMLAHLGAAPFDAAGWRPSLVRESAPAYAAAPRPAARTALPRRTAAVLLRSATRAHELARIGRHAAAGRLLARALRQLVARGETLEAARCALAAGTLALERGRIDLAADAFRQARELAPDSRLGVEAIVALGLAWRDGGRLIDAEGALRTALLAATGMNDAVLAAQAAAGLAECLRAQGRSREAACIPLIKAAPQESAPLAAAAARVHLALGNLPSAVRAARHAVDQAAGAGPAVQADARRALAEALTAAGDCAAALEHVEAGLACARRAHLPIESLRLQAVALGALPADKDARRIRAARLASAARRGIPRLLQLEIAAALSRADGQPVNRDTRHSLQSAGALGIEQQYMDPRGAVAELETLIALSHDAADDGLAMQRVCAELCSRLRALTVALVSAGQDGRTLALAGRPWAGEPRVALRVLASGLGVLPDRSSEPACAGEPVRYAGEVIAALAARWAAGVELDADRASALLRVGALAVAASARAVLDRSDPRAPHPRPDDIIGTSPPVLGLRDAIVRAARAPFPVLIEGESGSGKELVARAIHRLGPRRERRFCPVNCAALSDDLLEAELFGHARGAFTGAIGERPGLFEDADGGTIFLDEIGELSARAQAKLLRVLQDGEVRRVGENVSRRVDVRVVAATNRRLAQEAAAGRFRADLRFRLDVVRLDIPPLRDRFGDVPLLAAHFWADAAARVGSHATLSPDTLGALSRYDWPGNVRELQNVMAWMAVHSPRRGRIGPAALPAHIAQGAAPCGGGTFEAAREEFERRFVRAALAAANGRRASAAAAIGVSRQGLAKMLRRLGIEGV